MPRWAVRGFFVAINGRQQSVRAVPGTYLTLSRNWHDKDVIEIRMPLGFSLDPVMDRPNLASLFYGPVLLAGAEMIMLRNGKGKDALVSLGALQFMRLPSLF